MFDVFSRVRGSGDADGAPDGADDATPMADATDDPAEERTRPADCSPTDFRERAEALAGRSDVPELDYSEEALADLDSMATGTHPVDDALTYGSYLGETLVREYDGEWVREDGWRVAVALGDDETTVAVFDAARMALENGPVFAQVAERLHAQGDPYAEGTGADESVVDEAPTSSDADDAGAPAPTDDADASETDDLAPDEDGSPGTDGDTRDDEVTAADPQPDVAAVGATADAATPTSSSDESIDGGDATPNDGDDPVAVSGDDATGDEEATATGADDVDTADASTAYSTAASTTVGDESTPDDDRGDVAVIDPDESAAEESAASDGATISEEEGEPTVDASAATSDDEDTEGEPADVPDVDDSATERDVDDSATERDIDDSATETDVDDSADERDEADTDEVRPDLATDSRTDDRGDRSSVIDARSSELGVGPDGPTEADFARDPFDRPSSHAGAAAEESADEKTATTADPEPIDGERAPVNTADLAAAESDREPADVTPDEPGPTDERDSGETAGETGTATVPETATETARDTPIGGGGPADTGSTDAPDAEPDVATVTPSADAPSRSEYEPAAISLKNAWSDYDLDFSPGSLARLDTFLDDQWAGRFRPGVLDDSDVAPDASGPLVEVGAYVGEVLIQHYDAQWVIGEDGEPALAIPGRHGRTETFPVFDVARTSMTANARIAYAVDALSNRLDLPARASGAEETAFALGDDEPGTGASSADVITTILDRAEAFVAAWPGYDLNYRPASLVRLDNLAKHELDREAFRAATLGDRTDPDALRLADRAAGASAYFAAVLVRHLDAQWEIDDEVALAVEGPAGETRVVPFAGSVDCLRGEDLFMRRYDRVHDAVIEESRSTG